MVRSKAEEFGRLVQPTLARLFVQILAATRSGFNRLIDLFVTGNSSKVGEMINKYRNNKPLHGRDRLPEHERAVVSNDELLTSLNYDDDEFLDRVCRGQVPEPFENERMRA